MGLVDLYAVPPGADGWSYFWFNNWISHQGIVQAVARQNSVPLTLYDIDPWVDEAKEAILQTHQQYHTDMSQALGLDGQDLSVLNFDDPEAVRRWIWQHYNEHQAAHAALRL